MAKRFYDTGLVDQMWYQSLSPKRKALYIHLLCKCDVAGSFEINYPLMSAFVGEKITEDDLFESFGRRVVPLVGARNKDKGILVDFVYFQCGGVLNPNVKAHQSVLRRLDELGISVEELQGMCTHELKYARGTVASQLLLGMPENEPEPEQKPVLKRAKPNKQADGELIMRMFTEFYNIYPRHDGKQSALLKFATIMRGCKDDAERDILLLKMIQSVERLKKTEQWQKDGGKYIPMPSTWLNQRRWEDEGVKQQSQQEPGSSPFAKQLSKALSL